MLMNDLQLIGREEQVTQLDRCLGMTKPQLIVVYGRRRVGKTYLIDTYFDNRFVFKFTGVYRRRRQKQLSNFNKELSLKFGKQLPTFEDWDDAFFALRAYLDTLGDQKKVVFIDELPWLDDGSGEFLEALEYFWNQYGDAKKNLVFIACGSNTSYLLNKLIRGKGGFYNRKSTQICLEPFTLSETESFLESIDVHWTRRDIADCYMALGGIPYYLQNLRSDLTVSENIDDMLFRKKGPLWDEFDMLYQNLFRRSQAYIRIMEAVCETRYGLTREEVAKSLGRKTADGSISQKLKALSDCGFLCAYTALRDGKKKTLYRCADYFTFFYFRFVREHRSSEPHYWSSLIHSPERHAWEGFTYEWLCYDHIEKVKDALGIAGVKSSVFTWSASADEEKGLAGAQIDLVIDRDDRIVNLCEIKYTTDPFEIDKEEWWKLETKISRYVASAKKKKTVFLTVLSAEGVAKTGYASRVNKVLMLDALF